MAEDRPPASDKISAFDIERSPVLKGVPHGFFGSSGGAHQFGFGGPGEACDVAVTRAAAAQAILSGARIITPHQVHSADVVTVVKPWDDTPEGRPAADALVTAQRGLALGIVTADCAPVLFADRSNGVIGAAHAGWRGAHGGVLEHTIRAMEAIGADRRTIAAAIGPTIAQSSYEVDPAFREVFADAGDGHGDRHGDRPCDRNGDRHFAPAPMRAGIVRWRFDLPGYTIDKLKICGLEKIHLVGWDTFGELERYYSYRRASQRGDPNYGRQISVIALP
jgi:hypothetical protein